MGMYIHAFRRNEVTGQYLTQIDKHDLQALGMKSIGSHSVTAEELALGVYLIIS